MVQELLALVAVQDMIYTMAYAYHLVHLVLIYLVLIVLLVLATALYALMQGHHHAQHAIVDMISIMVHVSLLALPELTYPEVLA